MRKNISKSFSRHNMQVMALAVVAMLGSFSLGIQSAGNVRPVSLIEAGSVQQSGDIDGNGIVDVHDVKLILEIVQGYTEPTAQNVQADPNKDGKLTIDDAIKLLDSL